MKKCGFAILIAWALIFTFGVREAGAIPDLWKTLTDIVVSQLKLPKDSKNSFLKIASTTDPKNIRTTPAKKPTTGTGGTNGGQSDKIDKSKCETVTAKQGEQLDQIYLDKYKLTSINDDKVLYDLFRKYNPNYVGPGEKVYFPPQEEIHKARNK